MSITDDNNMIIKTETQIVIIIYKTQLFSMQTCCDCPYMYVEKCVMIREDQQNQPYAFMRSCKPTVLLTKSMYLDCIDLG